MGTTLWSASGLLFENCTCWPVAGPDAETARSIS